uniref:Hypothethical protein n=1 Tax=Ralstonia solanacearum TaxID=305 RepID=A0A0S4VTF4_RALSL|nr:Hypothethical protein [Ralstonia solanacearum]CUV32912.1 Hypothethical protein [Ralstonia solanacearum]CUV37839.1 Hypothethical protein [Ralstonia solanacearum]
MTVSAGGAVRVPSSGAAMSGLAGVIDLARHQARHAGKGRAVVGAGAEAGRAADTPDPAVRLRAAAGRSRPGPPRRSARSAVANAGRNTAARQPPNWRRKKLPCGS